MKYRYHNMSPKAILQRIASGAVISENSKQSPYSAPLVSTIDIDTVARRAGFTAEQFNEAYKVEKTRFMLCGFDIPTYRMECQQA